MIARAPLTLILVAALAPAANAQILASGDTHRSTISTPGEIDEYIFNASAGDAVILTLGEVLTAAVDPDFRPRLQLLRPDGALVASNTGLLAAHIDIAAPMTGVYSVRVSDGNTGAAVSAYALRLVHVPDGLTIPAGDEGGEVTDGLTYIGDIGPGSTLPNTRDPSDTDVYTFQALSGLAIAISVGTVETGGADGGLAPYLRLYGPNGALLAADAGEFTARITTTAPAFGTYTLVVSDTTTDREGSGTGRYRLSIANANIFGTYQISPGDQGGPIQAGQNTGAIERGDLDPWTFTTVRGASIRLTLTETPVPQPDPGFVPWIQLRAQDGTMVASAFDETTASIAITAPFFGTYTVLVSDHASDRPSAVAGSYSLSLVLTTPTFTVTPIAGPGGSIHPGTPQAVTLLESRQFVLQPDYGYWPDTVTGCNGQHVNLGYIVGPIEADCTFTATFRVLPPTPMSLDRTRLRFGATTQGTTVVSQTEPQIVRMRQNGIGDVSWFAYPTHPWVRVVPDSGIGSGDMKVSIVGGPTLPPNGTVTASINFNYSSPVVDPGPVSVTLTLAPHTTSAAPFGIVDTPTDNRTGVTGAVPFTGWALDDVQVTRVTICRSPFGAETAVPNASCGGAGQVFLGTAMSIEGARPDVAAAFPDTPNQTSAGWGFMLLSNMLPNQGNGTYVFHVYAEDSDGHTSLLGSKTMSCANAQATLPFGTIDTPAQGAVISGRNYVNFGWALTPMPKTIPFNGSSITVVIDGTAVGTVQYSHFRSDISALFPGYNNAFGAVGHRVIDTTALADGLHSIAWVVADDQGATQGIGSRYFWVSNRVPLASVSASAAVAENGIIAADEVAWLPRTRTVLARRGWNLDAPFASYTVDDDGRVVLRGEEIDRFELVLGRREDTTVTGYARSSDRLDALPIGSRLDPSRGTFTWAPGAGFVGSYDLLFVKRTHGRPSERLEVRIVVQPKGRATGPLVVIDVPRSEAREISQPFMLAGWALDLDAVGGTGVGAVHAWAYPVTGGAPVFLGNAEIGGRRPDVAAVHGERFVQSGYGLIASGLAPGTYDVVVFASSTGASAFIPGKSVRVTVQ